MKKAFIVLGPESSGTRFLTEILIAGGCHGDPGHIQRFDTREFNNLDPVVWRRSVPHNSQRLDLRGMLEKLKDYRVTVVVITRDWYPTERSQVSRNHSKSIAEATIKIKKALKSIFVQIVTAEIDYVLISYEALSFNPVETQKSLLRRLGLKDDVILTVHDGNKKWWGTFE